MQSLITSFPCIGGTMFKTLKYAILLPAAAAAISAGASAAENPGFITRPEPEHLKLTDKWDKVFKQSPKVDHSKVVFLTSSPL